jgi:hypothetical protein
MDSPGIPPETSNFYCLPGRAVVSRGISHCINALTFAARAAVTLLLGAVGTLANVPSSSLPR